MTEIIGVRFKEAGKVYFFDPAGLKAEAGQEIIVETSRGTDVGVSFGYVAVPNKQVDESEIVAPLKKAVRLATPEDCARAKANHEKEKEALRVCLACVEKRKLDMSLVDAEYAFDGSKLLFYFTSDGRVDFRDLVKELASIFRTRIELRQIGVRDEAKMLGGLGICGRPFCCSEFLKDFHPVSIKMAKEQSLSLNPTKISGTCGRLMCCLKYEQAAYEDAIKRVPKQDATVDTPDGRGTVIENNLLRETVKVVLAATPDAPAKVYPAESCTVVKQTKVKREKDSAEEQK